MADDTTAASVVSLHQPRSKRAKTPAERAKAYRQRKKASVPAVVAQVSTTLSESGKVTPVTPVPPPTIASGAVTPSRPRVAPILLQIAALALVVCRGLRRADAQKVVRNGIRSVPHQCATLDPALDRVAWRSVAARAYDLGAKFVGNWPFATYCTATRRRSLTGHSGNRQADAYCRGRRS